MCWSLRPARLTATAATQPDEPSLAQKRVLQKRHGGAQVRVKMGAQPVSPWPTDRNVSLATVPVGVTSPAGAPHLFLLRFHAEGTKQAHRTHDRHRRRQMLIAEQSTRLLIPVPARICRQLWPAVDAYRYQLRVTTETPTASDVKRHHIISQTNLVKQVDRNL